MADEIYIHSMNSVDIKGFNIEVAYLKQLLDTLSIVAEVVKTSDYKTGPENLTSKKYVKGFQRKLW